MQERHLIEELENVATNYPVFAGDTLSHQTARGCSDRGWIVRNVDGDWIPTKKGLEALREVKS